MKSQNILLIIFLLGWYYFSYQIFFNKNNEVGDSPQLRTRLGTILWHSSDRNGPPHIYCYYPKGSTQYSNKSGEYIMKREDNGDCSGWYGEAIFNEGSWVSEIEKIWWNPSQKLADDLAGTPLFASQNLLGKVIDKIRTSGNYKPRQQKI